MQKCSQRKCIFLTTVGSRELYRPPPRRSWPPRRTPAHMRVSLVCTRPKDIRRLQILVPPRRSAVRTLNREEIFIIMISINLLSINFRKEKEIAFPIDETDQSRHYQNDIFFEKPAARSGKLTASPSGKFCKPIPIARFLAEANVAAWKEDAAICSAFFRVYKFRMR